MQLKITEPDSFGMQVWLQWPEQFYQPKVLWIINERPDQVGGTVTIPVMAKDVPALISGLQMYLEAQEYGARSTDKFG